MSQFFSAFLSTGVPSRVRKFSASSFEIGAYSGHAKRTGLLASTRNDYYGKLAPRETVENNLS